MKPRKVLLIGGSGFVGGWIANRLYELNIRVTIPTRRRDHCKKLTLLPNVDTVQAVINNPENLLALMQGVDAVINLVGILHDRDSSQPYGKRFGAAHVELPGKIIAAMKQAGVRRLLHMSALGAAASAPSAYLRSKGAGEAVVLGSAKDLDVTLFRPSVIFGQNDAFLNMFARLLRLFPVLPIASGNTRFQPVYVGDVAEAFVDALSNTATVGKVYELCGPNTYTLHELAEYTARMIGKRRQVIDLPGPLAKVQATLLGWLPNPPMSPDNLRSLQVDSVTEGLRNYPGWQPRSLEAVAPSYLSAVKLKQRLDTYRCRAGR